MTPTSLAGSMVGRFAVGSRLRQIPERHWPAQTDPLAPVVEVWASAAYLVVIVNDAGHERMTVNRTNRLSNGRWGDGITWDALQRLKGECGRGGRWAVEVYPPDDAVVDVANMRHLWLLTEAPAFGWTTAPTSTPGLPGPLPGEGLAAPTSVNGGPILPPKLAAPASTPWTCRTFGHDPRLSDPAVCLDCPAVLLPEPNGAWST